MGATGEHIKPTDKGFSNRLRYAMEMKLWKKERINFHRERMEQLLDENSPASDVDWSELLEDHLIKTAQFQHERQVHLIVTMSVAVMSMVTICFTVWLKSRILLCLTGLLILLLIPYLFYYFMLENNVMAMYPIYDELREKLHKQRSKTPVDTPPAAADYKGQEAGDGHAALRAQKTPGEPSLSETAGENTGKSRKKDEAKALNEIAVLRCSVCTGEQVAGFKDPRTGEFRDVMLIRDDSDLKRFRKKYGVTDIKKEY